MYRRFPFHRRNLNHDDDDELILYDNDDDDDDLLDVSGGGFQGAHLQIEQIPDPSEGDVEPVYYSTESEAARSVVDRRQHSNPIDDDVEMVELQTTVNSLESIKPTSCAGKIIRKYAWFLSKFPYIPILLTIVVLVVFTWSSLHYYPFPDFSEDPTKGFETRGTYISKALSTLSRLESMDEDGITYLPNSTLIAQQIGMDPALLEAAMFSSPAAQNGSDGDGGRMRRPPDDYNYGYYDYGNNNTEEEEEDDGEGRVGHSADPCDCDLYDCVSNFPIFMFEPAHRNDDLYTVDAMHSICKFSDSLAPKQNKGIKGISCPVFSIAHLIATISNKQCEHITQVDVDYTKQLLQTCAQFTYEEDGSKSLAPALCTANNQRFVTDVLIKLAQKGFYDKTSGSIGKLTATALLRKDWLGTNEEVYFSEHFEGKRVGDDYVKLTAVRFEFHENLKSNLFAKYLIEDLVYFGLALGLVFLIVMLYLRSVVLMFVLLTNVTVSFSTAYFCYYFVLRMPFFPYLNLLAGLVLIAVGADDMFIIYDCFEQARHENPEAPIQKLMEMTLSHAAVSIFVTSATTSSAFFANALSSITSIQDFAIFAGICILVNLFYMVTLTPAVIVCMEKVYRCAMERSERFRTLNAKVEIVTDKLHALSVMIFCRIMPTIIKKVWFLCIFLLLSLGIGAIMVLFVNPKFTLPSSKDFKFFPASNVLENWDLKGKQMFESLDILKKRNALHVNRLAYYYLFGVIADDPGNHLDPDNRGEDVRPQFDPSFDIYSTETQLFINNLCHDMQKLPFLKKKGNMKPTCQFDAIIETLKDVCKNPLVNATQCCPQTIQLPFAPAMLGRCAALYQLLLRNNNNNFKTTYGLFIFSGNSTDVIGYKIWVTTTYKPSFDNEEMAEFDKNIRGFLDNHIRKGPTSVQNAFVAYGREAYWFSFYDLTRALATGTFYSIGLSLAVAFVMMLLTSWNLLITLYAMVTILLAISCTVAVLVFLGWNLGIIESIIVSLSVGLSIDFTIHFGIAYRLSDAATSALRTQEGFRTVGSAVLMAALTTFLAGAAMMPGRVLLYIQLGIFLMLVMSFSWIYSNFFFQSICHIIGPSKECQKQAVAACCCSRSAGKINDSNADLVPSVSNVVV